MSYVLCRTCANYKNEWCEKITDSPDPNYVRTCRHYIEATHHDMLLNMPVGVLAIWLEGVSERSSHDWLKWLNALAEGMRMPEDVKRLEAGTHVVPDPRDGWRLERERVD